MSLLTTTGLGKSFGGDDLFEGVTVEIPHGAKIALVGPNGAGKTTLIRMLIGLDEPTKGTITRSRGLSMGFLPQRPEIVSNKPLWDEMLTAFDGLRRLEAKLHEMAEQITERAGDADLMERYGQAQHDFELHGGYDYETRIKQVLQGLGFDADDYQKPMPILSGGQKTRALLAKLLLEAPDLLILDEPTNHLDIEAVEWLEAYLNSWKGALLLVSHDRYFMDEVATVIWEMDHGRLETYRGNYSAYLAQRQERWEYHMKLYETERERLLKELDYIKKNIVRDSTNAMAVGRLRQISRDIIGIQEMGLVAYKNAPSWSQTGIGSVRPLGVGEAEAAIKSFGPSMIRPREVRMRLNLKANARSGDKVLMTKNLTVGYEPAAPLFTVPDLTLLRGEVAAIIGPNGVGKSTFLKTLLGNIPALGGESKLGSQVKIGYFAQAHEALDEDRAIIDELYTVKPLLISQARDYLANFLFTGDDVFRPIKTLSGGERGRVALAKLALAGANFLLLDEPTNHLDIPAQEVLQNMVADFDGTVLLVSHDRYLIEALATQIWALTPGQFTPFNGGYRAFVAAREAAKQAATQAKIAQVSGRKAEQRAAEKRNGLSLREREKRVAALEVEIHQLEAKIAEIEAALATASAGGAVGEVWQLGKAYTAAQAELEAKMGEWEALAV